MTLELDSRQTFVVEDLLKKDHNGAAILAAQHGVTQKAVWRILSGKGWTHV